MWERLNFLEKVYLARIEVCGHTAGFHLPREMAKVRDPDNHFAFNCACDAVVFRMLLGLI